MKSTYSKEIKKIGEKLNTMNRDILNKTFWNIINDLNLDIIGISENKNGYKTSYPIPNIFNWYKNDENYFIKINELISCLNCGLNKTKIKFISPSLISITLKNMNYKALNEIILSYSEPSSGTCEKCSYINDRIKQNIFYHTCKQKIVKDILFPNILVFILDLSDENNKDEMAYINLVILKLKYKHLIVDEFFLINDHYILSEIINQKTINHYISCIINNWFEKDKLQAGSSYYYDGLDSDNYLKEFKILDKNKLNDSVLI